MILTIVRWFVFLPFGALLILLAQIITDLIAKHFPWWMSMPTVLFFGIIIGMAGMLPVNLAPNRKAGASIFIPCFVLIEIAGFSAIFHQYDVPQLIVHFYVDLAIIAGAFLASQYSKESI